MSRSPFVYPAFLGLLLLVLSPKSLQSQALAADQTIEERYKSVLSLMAEQQYERVIVECQTLLQAAPRHYYTYLTLVRAARAAGKLDAVRAWFASRLAETPPWPLAQVGIGLVHQVKGEGEAALTAYQRGWLEAPDIPQISVLLARQFLALKKLDEGEAYFKEGVSARPTSAAAHFGLGQFYYWIERYPAAVGEYEQARKLEPHSPAVLYELAAALSMSGRHPETLTVARVCLTLLEEKPEFEVYKAALSIAGTTSRRVGDYGSALIYLEKSLNLARETGDGAVQEYALSQLGELNLVLNRFARAADYYRQALQVAQKLGPNGVPQRHLNSIGYAYYQLGEYDAARYYLNEALTGSLAAKDEVNRASVLQNLAHLEMSEKAFPQAKRRYQEALEIAEQRANTLLQIEISVALAEVNRQLGEVRSALTAAQIALELAQRTGFQLGEGEALNALGEVRLVNNEMSEAETVFQRAQTIGQNSGTPHVLWQALAGLAVLNERRGDWQRARELYQQAVDVIEQVRAQLGSVEQRAGYFQDKTAVYDKLVRMLMLLQQKALPDQTQARRYSELAFHYTERARARALTESISRTGELTQLDPALQLRRWELYARFSQLETQLRSTKTPLESSKRQQIEQEMKQVAEALQTWRRDVRQLQRRVADWQDPTSLGVAQVQQLLVAK